MVLCTEQDESAWPWWFECVGGMGWGQKCRV